jgi:hypothetical protein
VTSRRSAGSVASLALLLLLFGVAAPVAAQGADGDGLYGRFDSDGVLTLGAGAGANLHLEPIYLAELRARYLDSAGIAVAPEWNPEGDAAVALLLEVRPLFLARFLGNGSTGNRWLDLTIDSVGLEIGTWIGPLESGLGAALALGGGLELPLGLARSSARGLWLRVGIRYVHASHTWTASPGGNRDETVILACLLYRLGANTGLAGWEPARYVFP